MTLKSFNPLLSLRDTYSFNGFYAALILSILF